MCRDRRRWGLWQEGVARRVALRRRLAGTTCLAEPSLPQPPCPRPQP